MKTLKPQKTKPTIPFNAKLIESMATKKNGLETILTLPNNTRAKLPSREKIMVEGTINTFPFRAALELNEKGNYFLKVSKDMLEAVRINILDTVTVEITRVEDEPETRVPIDLEKVLRANPKAQISWGDITPNARRDWIFSICEAKQKETRERRIEKACDMLKSGKRRLCCFPGIKWMMKKNAKTCGMWLPLTKLTKV